MLAATVYLLERQSMRSYENQVQLVRNRETRLAKKPLCRSSQLVFRGPAWPAICYRYPTFCLPSNPEMILNLMAGDRKIPIQKLLLNDLPPADLLLLVDWRDPPRRNLDVRQLSQFLVLLELVCKLFRRRASGDLVKQNAGGGALSDNGVRDADAGELCDTLDDLSTSQKPIDNSSRGKFKHSPRT